MKNERNNFFYFVIISGCIFTVLTICGCATTKSPPGITELATGGSREIGRINQLDKELDRIQQSARDELTRAADSLDDLGAIIQRVFDIAYDLCDSIDAIRAGLKQNPQMGSSTGNNSGDLDSTENR